MSITSGTPTVKIRQPVRFIWRLNSSSKMTRALAVLPIIAHLLDEYVVERREHLLES